MRNMGIGESNLPAFIGWWPVVENGQSKGKGCATAPTRERRHEGIKIAPLQASSIEIFTQRRRRHKIEILAIGLLSQASEGPRNSTLQSGAIPVIQLLSICQSSRKWPGCKGPSTALAGVCRSVACRRATKSATVHHSLSLHHVRQINAHAIYHDIGRLSNY